MFPIEIRFPTQGRGWGDVAFVLVPLLGSLVVVWLAHLFTKKRDEISYRRLKIEEFYVAGRQAIGFCTETALAFLPAAKGEKLAADVVKEFTQTSGKEFAEDRPTFTIDMLVELYFNHARGWMDRLYGTEQMVRRAARDLAELQKIYQGFDAISHEAIEKALRIYAELVHELAQIVREENQRLDATFRWLKIPRWFRRGSSAATAV